MIKMQNQNKKFCPLCRSEVLQKANESMLFYSSHSVIDIQLT
jgi:hypothetical protein